MEKALAIKWYKEACAIVGTNLQTREYLNYPKPDESMVHLLRDPGDEEQSALPPLGEMEEVWTKCVKRWNRKHGRDYMTEEQLRNVFQAYNVKEQKRKR